MILRWYFVVSSPYVKTEIIVSTEINIYFLPDIYCEHVLLIPNLIYPREKY